ncbi:MAG: excinuclease ABC subunit C [Bacteroidales bacterium]|nr:excinuclease ABC subunit C [Bacteroidales bacterium]
MTCVAKRRRRPSPKSLDVRQKIQLLPHSPGVYRYYDAAGNVIYVGKAKDLNKRVAQYFVDPARLNIKTRVLVSRIADVQYSVVDTEADALLLENNLIKQYKPRYNILLKDSKTYPWICVTGDEFPKVFLTRRVLKNGSRYFGPYSSVMHAKTLLEFFRETYPLRSCNLKITSDAILRRKFRPCLEFHIGRCEGCCVGGVSREDYNAYIDEIVRLLTGGVNSIIRDYKARMTAAAEALDFEAAQAYKQRIDALQKHYAKSIITAAGDRDVDVFSLESDGQEAFGNFLRIRGGAIIQSLNLGFKMNIEEDRAAVLSEFLAEISSKFGALRGEVIVPFLPDVEMEGVDFKIPVRGDKLALLELSTKNAKEFRANALKMREHTDPDEYKAAVLEELRKALGMKELPVHMECFDNSNIQGTNPVASCVVFRNAEPSKKDYRKFKIKTVVGANDYASMKEVVNRRYARMLEEAPDDLPQLVVIDGGKGQLEFAWQALCELGIQDRLTVVGLAKRLEEVIRVGDPYPLFLDRNSRALKVLQQIRDEAHRFGITFHRSLRSKAAIQSALREIKGVGEQTEQRLLMHFGSVARIAAAPVEQLSALVGPALAARIHEQLNNG